jgi:signal peptidase I
MGKTGTEKGKKLGDIRLILDEVYKFEGMMLDGLGYSYLTSNGNKRTYLDPRKVEFLEETDYYKEGDQVVVFDVEVLEVYGK